VLTTLPPSVQLVKVEPLLAVAVTVRDVPPGKLPPPLTLPALAGEALTVIVKVWAKLATRVRLAVSVKV